MTGSNGYSWPIECNDVLNACTFISLSLTTGYEVGDFEADGRVESSSRCRYSSSVPVKLPIYCKNIIVFNITDVIQSLVSLEFSVSFHS